MKRAHIVALLVAGVLLIASAGAAQFQRRGGRFGFGQIRENPAYDGAFQFCRIMFRNASNGDGGGWAVDYPRADQNLSFRFSELTTTSVSSDGAGNFNHSVIRLTDEATLARCPFIMITEPGGTYLDELEATALRTYLQKGGFLWADDFWGEYAWEHWVNEIRKALPSGEYPVADLPLEHGVFHMLYDVQEVAQIPSIGAWGGPGGRTSERARQRHAARARDHGPRRPRARHHDPQHRLRRRVRARRLQTARTSRPSPAPATRSASTRCCTR